MMNNSLLLDNFINSSTVSVHRRGKVLIIVESAIFLVLNVAAFVGNLLICLAIYRNPSLRTTTNNFIVSLAITDLIMAIVVMPVYTVSSMLDRWIAGETVSQIVYYCLLHSLFTTITNVSLIAINRYYKVVKPYKYGNIYTKKSSSKMVVSSWLVSLAIISSFVVSGVRYEMSKSNPTIDKLSVSGLSSVYIAVLGFIYVVLPIFGIVVCYVKIYKTIRHHNTAVAPSTQEGNSPYGVDEAKITRLLTTVVTGYCVCWYPAIICTTLGALKLLPSAMFKYIVFMRLFPVFTSSVLNPIIYGFLNQAFRSEFLKIIRCT